MIAADSLFNGYVFSKLVGTWIKNIYIAISDGQPRRWAR